MKKKNCSKLIYKFQLTLSFLLLAACNTGSDIAEQPAVKKEKVYAPLAKMQTNSDEDHRFIIPELVDFESIRDNEPLLTVNRLKFERVDFNHVEDPNIPLTTIDVKGGPVTNGEPLSTPLTLTGVDVKPLDSGRITEVQPLLIPDPLNGGE